MVDNLKVTLQQSQNYITEIIGNIGADTEKDVDSNVWKLNPTALGNFQFFT